MRSLQRFGCWGLLCLSLALFGASARAADWTSEQRVIVKWKSNPSRDRPEAFAATSRRMNTLAGVELASGREIDEQREVVRFNKALSIVGFQSALKTLREQANVEYAVQDQRRHVLLVPNDEYFSSTSGRTGQWYLQNVEPAAVNAVDAWDLGNVTNLSSNSIVAVIDTGVRFDHPDLSGKLLPGYDFVSCDQANCSGSNLTFLTANDGDGWDSDASDPGDWISASDLARSDGFFKDCGSGSNQDQPTDSSWHGTRVSGVIGASSNNNIGIAGTGWNTRILPVRALGKCGGFDSDIIAAMRWAAGLSVTGAPTNPYPARVINMSVGGAGTCTPAYQDIVDELHTTGVVVVASAGNEGGPVDVPANCSGVVGVAGVRNSGTKVGYSSLGSAASIAAPAGNCVNLSGACLFSIDTTYNLGATTPGMNSYTDQTNTNLGTSFSAPIVSGIASIMLSVNGNLKADQLISRLQASAQAFPANPNTGTPTCHVPTGSTDLQTSECYCTTSTCGAGLAKADAAVREALRPIAAVALPASVAAGQVFALDASGSAAACGHSIASYSWAITSGTPPNAFADSNSASITMTAPNSGTFVVTVTVTDDAGAIDTASVTVTPSSTTTTAAAGAGSSACLATVTYSASGNDSAGTTATSAPAAPAASSGGGGGSFTLGGLLGLGLLALGRRKKGTPAAPRRMQANNLLAVAQLIRQRRQIFAEFFT